MLTRKQIEKIALKNRVSLFTQERDYVQAVYLSLLYSKTIGLIFKGDDLPVEMVSWNDVQEFIKKLNQKEGTNKYRLPSEAEWEYVARAGTTTKYSFGDDDSKLGDYVWYGGITDGTHPVGQKKPNPWGLYDMHGNVWEWVQDSWHDSYNGAPTDGSAWVSGDGSSRVFRGGSWSFSAVYCRSAARNSRSTGYRLGTGIGSRDGNLGFRLLMDLQVSLLEAGSVTSRESTV